MWASIWFLSFFMALCVIPFAFVVGYDLGWKHASRCYDELFGRLDGE